MKRGILTLIACLIGISENGYSSNMCRSKPVKDPTASVVQLNKKQKPFYQDLMNRCESIISDLTISQERARRISLTGNLMAAALQMKNAIEAKARTLPPPFAGGANPHTMEAIRVAAAIANSIYVSTQEKLPALGGMLVGQIRFNTLDKAIDLVKYSYEELDSEYFLSNINACYGGCQARSLPRYYFDGVKNLALSYLEFQQDSGSQSADDTVELFLAKAMVSAAKETLARSLSRRELSCQVRALHVLEEEVYSALCTGNYGIRLSDSIGFVRKEIAKVISSIRNATDSDCQSYH